MPRSVIRVERDSGAPELVEGCAARARDEGGSGEAELSAAALPTQIFDSVKRE